MRPTSKIVDDLKRAPLFGADEEKRKTLVAFYSKTGYLTPKQRYLASSLVVKTIKNNVRFWSTVN